MKCQNNVKQLALALQMYHDAHKKLMPASTYNYKYCGPGVNPDWTSADPNKLTGPICYSLANFPSTSTTIAFADAATVMDYGVATGKLTETFYLEPPSGQYPK